MSQKIETLDPMIEEVRAIRRELSERFDNDVYKLGHHLQELERQHASRVVQPAASPSKPQRVG